jgi:transposase
VAEGSGLHDNPWHLATTQSHLGRISATARSVGKSKLTVWRWQERFLAEGLVGLRRDATRPGRKPPLSAATIERVVHKALHEKRVAGTHWSIRNMARATDLSCTSVQRIWKAHELKPHLVKTFKLSNDKRSVQNTGYCRPLSRPAGQGTGVLGRRKKPDPGAGSNGARLADQERPVRHYDARLQTP